MKKMTAIAACATLALLVSGCRKKPTTAGVYNTTTSSVAYYQAEPSNGGAPVLNDSTFDSEITNSQGVAIVDFFAHWCGPCQRMLPIIDTMATETSDAKIAKVDVDVSEQTAKKFDVDKMPCFVIFKDGREVERHYGLHTKNEIRGWIDSHSEKAVSLAR